MKNFKSFEDIINNKNLLFDIKNDSIFRNVFLNKCSLNYVCKLLYYLLGYDLNDLKIVNNEHPSNSAFSNINRSDIIYEYRDIYIIFEMNLDNMEFHINKNYQYLFKQHSSRLNNKNKYKKKTILINIDNYDVGKENELLYDSKLYLSKYYTNIYNLIDILHINVDSLKNKMYNDVTLNDLERLLIIFVEQNKCNLMKKNVEREVIDIMDYIARMDFREGAPVTYNYVEAEKVKHEMALIHEKEMKEREHQLYVKEQEIDDRAQEVDVRAQEVEAKVQELEEEKIEFAKALKAEGYPMNKIFKLTKLPKSKIMML